MKTLLFALLFIPQIASAELSDWYFGLLTPKSENITLGASAVTYSRTILPIDSTENLGTTTSAWDELHINEICLSSDCKTAWPSVSGSSPVSTSTNETAGYLPYWTTTSGTPALLGKVATTSVTCTGGTTCTGFTVIGASPITIDSTTGNWATTSEAYYWSQFRDWSVQGDGYLSPTTTRGIILSASSTISDLTVTNGTTTNATSTNLSVSGVFDVDGLTSALTLTGATGIFAEYTGTSGTNQFLTALSPLGVGTFASVNNDYWSGTDLSVANGGTGASTLTGLLQGNGASAFTAIADSSTAGQVLRVTGASTYGWGALDFDDTDAFTGTLPNTALENSTISGVALGSNLFALTNDTTLNGSSYNGSSAISDWGLNLANENIWTSASTTFTGGVTIGTSTTTSATTTSLFSTTASSTNLYASTATLTDASVRDSLAIPNGSAPTVNATGETAVDATSDQFIFYGASAKKVLGNGSFYPAFTYATTTTWTGTTTIPLGPAYVAETWNGVKCFTDASFVAVSFNDGTNRMNYFIASTTVGSVPLSTNNTFTAGEKRYVDIGTTTTATTLKVSCTIDKSITAD